MVRKLWLICLLCFLLALCFVSCRTEDQGQRPGTLPLQSPTSTVSPTPGVSQTPAIPTERPYAPYREEIPASALTWIQQAGTSGDLVLLSQQEILALNETMRSRCDALVNILKPPSQYSKRKVYEKIISASNPALPKYTEDGTTITHILLEEILANRNLDGIPSTVFVQKGIVTARCNLRTLPTNTAFFQSLDDRAYDRIQETELLVGMPVWVLHTSTDGLFYYVQSSYYRGWVSVEAIALVDSDEAWKTFAEAERFVLVTLPRVMLGETELNMSVKLPCLNADETGFSCLLPARDEAGKLVAQPISLSVEQAHEGYLPYTRNNLLVQAFLYEGTPYSWGGKDGGVDCSSYMCNVFRCFGLILPRNTAQQQKTVGTVFDTGKLSVEERQTLVSGLTSPALFYTKGHVMLYLGQRDNTNVILHAPQAGKNVSSTSFPDLSGLLYVAVLGPVME